MAKTKNGSFKQWMKKPAVRGTMKAVSAVFKCLLTILLIGAITVTIVGCVMIVYVVQTFKGDAGIPNLADLSQNSITTVSIQNEEGEWEPYMRLQGENSIYTSISDIPRHMQQAVIAIEDERFETHYGVDWKRTVAAMLNLVKTRVFGSDGTEYGGSTITQQLIKVTTGDNDHSIQRKITEIFRAVEMEKQYSKQEILEAYLNVLPLSNNISGVGAGAQYFFGKDIRDISIAEAACLASITQNPSRYNPYTHPENIRQRQLVVLRKMYELDFITAGEYQQAVGEELHFKNSLRRTTLQDYYTDLLIEDVIADLMDKYGYTYRYAQNLVFYGGLNIHSAENPAQQQAVEEIFANDKNYPAHLKKDEVDPQAAIFIMDYDGRVVATVGGRGEKTANRVLNRSTQSKRSPGSSIKPITSYGPAIYYNMIHYSSVVRDCYLTLNDGIRWPSNFESSPKDNGNVLVNYAIKRSLNTVPARLVDEMTPNKSFDFATGIMRLSTLVKSRSTDRGILTDIALSPLALGAFTDGVYAREMAAAYAIYGGGGLYNEPYTYYEVSRGEENNKEVLLTKGPINIRAVDESTAYVMVKLMEEVTRAGNNGTGSAIGSSWPGWEVFGKTGTGESNTDVYFCGGTAYYVGACWFGYDNNQSLSGSAQTSAARNLWNLAMKAIHNGLQPKAFDKKGETSELQFCSQTGLIATDACPNKQTGYYKNDNIPGTCTAHGGAAAPESETSAAAGTQAAQ